MAAFNDVAKTPIANLLDPSKDKPTEIPENDLLKVAADALTSGSVRGVIVTNDAGDQIVSFLTSADIVSAMSRGMTMDTPIGQVVAGRPKPVTVSADLPLEDLPSQIGALSMVVVVDADNKPTGVLDRKDLAERVVKLG
jgi:predicted transcriptional regulator